MKKEFVESFFTESNHMFLSHDLVVFFIRHQVLYKNTEIPLTNYQFNVLTYFIQHPQRVSTKAQILQIAGSEDPQDEDNAVRCLIAGIRKKLRKYTNKEYIQTVRGVGYRFEIA